jgi:hypothetical protein
MMTVRTDLHQIALMLCAYRNRLKIPCEGQIDIFSGLPPFFQAARAPSLGDAQESLLAKDLSERK